MGKGKKSHNKVKYLPMNEEIINTLTQDKSFSKTKVDVASNKSKLENNECNLNEKVITQKIMSLDHQYENSSGDKKKQTGKMEFDVSESINVNKHKVCEEMNKNSHSNEEKKTKISSSNQNTMNSSECLDGEAKFENKNKKLLKDGKKGSKSDKKEKTKECSLDQQSIYSSLDEKTDCETKHINKNNNKACEKRLIDQKSQNDSVEKLKYEISDCNNKKDERKFNNNSDSNKKKKIKFKTLDVVCNVYHNFLEEIDEDLFKLPNEIALAHCVAEDLRMGAGIAVDFKIKFGGVGKLVDQKLKIGDVGIVNRHNQNVFYLITKKNSNGKPTMMTLEKALESLLSKMKDQKLTKLGIPKIGCGLDGLDWSNVKSLIIKIFAGSGIHISVCVPSKILDRKAPSQLKVYMTSKNLWEMEPQTDIIIFIDLEKIKINDWTDNIINKVDNRYPFKKKLLKDVENKKLKSGEILCYPVNNEKIFCVIFEQNTFYECVENIFAAKHFKLRNNTNYLAIQSGSFNSDDTFKHIVWIVLIFRSISSYNELWLCGDTELNGHGISYDAYYRNLSNSNMKNDYSSSSSMSRDYKYNDNNQSPYSKERRFNNSWNGSSPQKGFDTYNDSNRSSYSKEKRFNNSCIDSSSQKDVDTS